ncbi:hypothetical protein [Legionella feeleii]|uniref:Uncharacterized protein n=1 Tax=Legionella feeleii TaxID=453 RepID=A0A0W0TH20_9GAMM|nr:hypothetical protein [Legionella feeleii]KTC94888.1 hypothetical protein Lfee_2552 [Legionella feeleii]SPX62028.1 Uncharacterised protein [Legionella feeleii]
MNLFELTAVSNFLSCFPDDMTYPVLISRLTNGEIEADDAIVFWQPFEGYCSGFIAECIETLRQQLVERFIVNPQAVQSMCIEGRVLCTRCLCYPRREKSDSY